MHVFDRSVRRGVEELGPQYLIDSKLTADKKIETLLAGIGLNACGPGAGADSGFGRNAHCRIGNGGCGVFGQAR